MREKASHTKSGNAAKLQGSSKQYRPSSRKQEKSEINNLTYHLKRLEKEQTKTKFSRKEEIKDQRGNKIEI